jgi:hypothetical protein
MSALTLAATSRPHAKASAGLKGVAGCCRQRFTHHTEGATMNNYSDLFEARELAHRSGDGIDVSLLWDPQTDEPFVFVIDERDGACHVIPVGFENPMDVYTHPFAFAR